MKWFNSFLLAVLLGPSVLAQQEDANLEKFFREYLEESFRMRPMDATRLGDHRFDHLVVDLSPAARAGWKKHWQKALNDLPKRIDYQHLTRAGQIDYEIWMHDLERTLWLVETTRPFEEDTRIYNEYISDSIYLLLAQSSLPKATAIQSCVARMAFIPQVVEAAKASLQNPPRVFVETAIRQNRGAIAFYEHGIYELAGETPQLSELRTATKPVIACLKEYQQFLEKELRPQAKGEWRLGKEKFA